MLEQNLGYFFFNKDILRRSLTTKAYALEQQFQNQYCEDQEAYAVVGERLLQTVVSERLIRYGYTTAQDIVHWTNQLIAADSLAQISQSLGVDVFMKLSQEEKQNGYSNTNLMARTLQAIVGGIYFDGGFRAASEVIHCLFKNSFE